jgi:hypothetical protein
VSETVKQTIQPYFVLRGNVCGVRLSDTVGAALVVRGSGVRISKAALAQTSADLPVRVREGWRACVGSRSARR